MQGSEVHSQQKEAALADFSDLRNRVAHAVVLAAIGLTCLAFELGTYLFLLVLTGIFIYEVITSFDNQPKHVQHKARYTTVAVLMLGVFGFGAAASIRYDEHGFYSLLLVALGVAATDIFAYVGGKKFGRTQFAPKISPNKTWEGVLIGMMMGTLTVYVTWQVLHETGNTSISLFAAVVLGLCLPVVAVLGDLLESKAKRLLEVKDFGKLLGSHGGVADRFDAMTAGFAFFGLLTFFSL